MSLHRKDTRRAAVRGQRSLVAFAPSEIRVENSSPIRTQELQDTLRGLSEHRTIRAIAKGRNVDVSAIYKQRDWLRKNGYLSAQNELTSAGLECLSGGLRTLQFHTTSYGPRLPVRHVRLHDLRFRVQILRYFDARFALHRRQLLECANIPYGVHRRANWDGYVFALDSWRVEVTPRSFLLLAPDVLTRDAQQTLLDLYLDVKKIVRKLEARFPVRCLEKGDRLNVVVEGHHAARINDALAKKYNQERRVFELRDEKGDVRLVIDNSLRLNEFEAVHPVWAVDDESRIKRLYHEAVVQDISLAAVRDESREKLASMRSELEEIKGVLSAQVAAQRLQMEAGVRSHAQVRKLAEFFGGGE